jgi:hypothetical protein
MNNIGRQTADKLRQLGPDKSLRILIGVLAALVALQGMRYVLAGPFTRGFKDSSTGSDGRKAMSRNVTKTSEEYRNILEAGVLGTAPKEKSGPPPVYLFGVMGREALIGSSAGSAKLLAVGDDVGGGEKLVEILVEDVVLEKDGEKRTVNVFDSPTEKPSKDKRGKPPSQDEPPSAPPPSAPPPGEPSERPPSPSRQGRPPGGQIPPGAIEHLRAMQAAGEEIPAEVLEQVAAAGIVL